MQIAIPGVTDNTGIDTNKLIQDLLEVEKQPIVRTENRIKESEDKQTIWRDINTRISLLQDSAKKLYGFNSPFREKEVSSSHPNIVTAQAARHSTTGKYGLVIKQTAQSDRWLSQVIDKDYNVPQGNYVFTIASQEISFQFSGKNIEELIDIINIQGKDKIKASAIKQGMGDKSNVFLLEGLISGELGKLSLSKTAETFAKDIKLLGINPAVSHLIPLTTNNITNFISKESLFENIIDKESDAQRKLKLYPGAVGTIQISSSLYSELINNQNSIISVEMYATAYEKDIDTQNDISKLSVQLEDVIVHGESLHSLVEDSSIKTTDDASLESEDISSTATEVDTSSLPYTLIFNTTLESQFKLSSKEIKASEVIRVKLPISTLKIDDNTLEFTLANPFPKYVLTIHSVSISDNTIESDFVPLQPINKAQNAIVEFNGIDIERDTNTINNIIPGITLAIKRADKSQPIDITVVSDTQTIKDDIITFIGSYNQTMQSLIIYTRNDVSVLEDIDFPSETEREFAKTNLGILSNEFGLTRLLNNLQSTISGEYNNSVNPDITSLRSIGIAPNLVDTTSIISTSKFLDIDEPTLDNAITDNADAIAVLLGVDTNNDIIIDYGVAFKTVESTDPYAQTNGIITQKQRTLNSKIERDKKDLIRYNSRLVRYESELKRKFGSMEQIVKELNSSSNSINSITQQNQK